MDWQAIAVDPPAVFPEPERVENIPVEAMDTLVRQVRSQHQDKIQDQSGTLQLLDISHPVNLSKWDETRGIERDEIYQGFALPQTLK